MYKSYVFRLYPNKMQKQIINQSMGNARFIYNYFLNDKKNEYEKQGFNKPAFEQIKLLPQLYNEYSWLKDGDSCGLRTSIFNLDNAYKRFYNGSGYPRFKSKGVKEAYKTNNIISTYKGKRYESIKLNLKDRTIILPKLKEVKIRGYRNKTNILGVIKSTVVKKEADKYYVSVLVDEEYIKPVFIPKNIIGIDLGIKDLIVTSNNEKIKNSIDIKKYQRKIKGLQRALARAKPSSKNGYKLKLKLQTVYKKLKNARKHLIINITNKLVKENDIIITEDLDVKSMYQEHSIARSMVNTPLGEIISMLKYKCEKENKN